MGDVDSNEDDEEDYGPNLPSGLQITKPLSGPAIPTMQDLDFRKGTLFILSSHSDLPILTYTHRIRN